MKSCLKTVKRLVLRALDVAGFNPLRMLKLRRLPRYLGDLYRFGRSGGEVGELYPVLADFDDEAGCAMGHYFHQDLLVAQAVHARNPGRHVDVGSRIDGFVAHVASFREIEILDARPLKDTGHPNIRFTRLDLGVESPGLDGMADSVSCLHALEHFGLGRYGDVLDPRGHITGLHNLCRMLKPGGALYVSVPIGRHPRVAFNAHRVFEPLELPQLAQSEGMRLAAFHLVDDRGELHRDWPLHKKSPEVDYGCGIYIFNKETEL